MSNLKIDIPDIKVVLDKGDNYNVIVNRPSSIVRQVTGSFFSVADFAFNAATASVALTVLNQDFSGSFTGSLLGTSSYALNADLLDGMDSMQFATTSSNFFIGDQTISGSAFIKNGNLLITGSVGITGGMEISGSVKISNSGILQLFPQETPNFVSGGIFFSSSGEFYVGISI